MLRSFYFYVLKPKNKFFYDWHKNDEFAINWQKTFDEFAINWQKTFDEFAKIEILINKLNMLSNI